MGKSELLLRESDPVLLPPPLRIDLIEAIDGGEKGARKDLMPEGGAEEAPMVMGPLVGTPKAAFSWTTSEWGIPPGRSTPSSSMSLVCERKRTKVKAGSSLEVKSDPWLIINP